MNQIVLTTPAFRRGQAAARSVATLDCDPNWPLVKRGGAEFAAGFRYEWTEYVEPMRGVK